MKINMEKSNETRFDEVIVGRLFIYITMYILRLFL